MVMRMINTQFGEVKLHLDEQIEKKGISKNKLAFKAEIQRTQLNNYCKGKVLRIDLAVLARICTVLECSPGDILEYIPPKNR